MGWLVIQQRQAEVWLLGEEAGPGPHGVSVGHLPPAPLEAPLAHCAGGLWIFPLKVLAEMVLLGRN